METESKRLLLLSSTLLSAGFEDFSDDWWLDDLMAEKHADKSFCSWNFTSGSSSPDAIQRAGMALPMLSLFPGCFLSLLHHGYKCSPSERFLWSYWTWLCGAFSVDPWRASFKATTGYFWWNQRLFWQVSQLIEGASSWFLWLYIVYIFGFSAILLNEVPARQQCTFCSWLSLFREVWCESTNEHRGFCERRRRRNLVQGVSTCTELHGRPCKLAESLTG